mmetsp:Transcript_96500/g.201641  ORF Transcript_96500/g.201641 Transcript_96500/m.201641 type:complete len:237 (-) Transcript_96500:191-901(-)
MREQRLSDEGLREGLRLSDSLALAEETQGVFVWALGVQVEHNADHLITSEALSAWCLFLARAEVALRVEKDVLVVVTEYCWGSRSRKAHAEELSWRWGTAAAGAGRGFCGVEGLDNFDFEHVATGFHGNVRTSSCNQVLHATLGQGHQYPTTSSRDDIESHVSRLVDDRLAQSWSFVGGRIRLFFGTLCFSIFFLGGLLRRLVLGSALGLPFLGLLRLLCGRLLDLGGGLLGRHDG